MTSWLDIPEDSDFSLQNIPFGVCSLSPTSPHCCVTAIGKKVVDLNVLQDAGAFSDIADLDANVFSESSLNNYLAHPPEVWPKVRRHLMDLFNGNDELLSSNEALQQAALYDMDDVTMHLPCKIGDYTDFYSSREHATNVGTMFRGKDNALQPNWLHLPVGYHGRASTVQISGEPVVRPHGQLQIDPNDPKKGSTYGPCKSLDFELEVAFFVGGPPNHGPMPMEEAKRRIFGFCLMNDWSARDVQKWEYVPLGPFTAKNFATSISPWIVSKQALEPFVVPTSAGKQENPTPLEYLQDPGYSSYDIQLSVAIQSPNMKEPHVVCRSNFANLYWNAAQQLVHHSVTGCIMNPGDLLASGTISGLSQDAFGSMLELSWKGSRLVELSGGESRKFLQDGDTVVMKGVCSKPGHGRVGFGVCRGKVLPAGSSISPTPAVPVPIRYQNFKLYSYSRSSSSWRVRIALTAKGIPFEVIPVNVKHGEHKTGAFLEKNPLGQVPVLEYTDTETGTVKCMTQSVAIIEFLDMCFPQTKSLFPMHPMDKIVASEMVEVINSGIQPLQNAPMVMNLELAFEGEIVAQEFAKDVIVRGLQAMETLIQRRKQDGSKHSGPFCLGNFSPSIVDAFLIPQLYNARRFGVNVDQDFPILASVDRTCATHPWFVPVHATVQVDAED
jgi:fumarylacetoacetase